MAARGALSRVQFVVNSGRKLPLHQVSATTLEEQRIEFLSGFRIAKPKKEKGLVDTIHLTLKVCGAAGRN